jgi:allophanate hydrolase
MARFGLTFALWGSHCKQRVRLIHQHRVGALSPYACVSVIDLMHSPGLPATLDLASLARLYGRGELTPRDVVASLLEKIRAYPDPSVWIDLIPPEEVYRQAEDVVARRRAGAVLPLYGVPFAVKDNIDVAGRLTTAACPAFAYRPDHTAPVVRRFMDAGAVLIGKTNLDQFACGLMGDRSPYGVCRNVFDPKYISGGSSSGSAVAVAAGMVTFALGTDTAGSGRIPAGCNNIVGLKPTLGLLSTEGVVPACRSLDCVSIFALGADDAYTVFRIGAGADSQGERPLWHGLPTVPQADAVRFTFAVPADADLEFYGDGDQAALFRQAVSSFGRFAELPPVAVGLEPFLEVSALLYEGPWVAERLAVLDGFLREHSSDVHPVTRAILARGAGYSAVDAFKAMHRLQELRPRCMRIFEQAEILVVPTLPALPTRAEVAADSALWSRRLGRTTNFVNMLGLSALAVPCGFGPKGLPGGITLIAPAGREQRLAEIGMAWQRRTKLPLGATNTYLPTEEEPAGMEQPQPVAQGMVRVAVAGAHLRGQPLHNDLLRTGAQYVRTCRTAALYRFVALMNLKPPRPGLLRDHDRAGAITVEIFDLPTAGFGELTASVASPLAIGTIELEDGEAVKGFLCESFAAAQARDVTDFGGWVAFRQATG